MSVRLVGEAGNQVALYRRASRFFIKYLLGEDAWRIRISVNFTSKIGLGNAGEARKSGRRDVRIRIKPGMNTQDTLETLAHELVHARQFYRGELGYSGMHPSVWMGKKHDLIDEKYESLPWEKEARSMQKKMVSAFRRHERISND